MKSESRKAGYAFSTAALLAIFVLAGTCGIAYALFAGHDEATNDVSIAYLETSIQEEFEPPAKLEPGIDIPKTVQVKNAGTAECYVRVLCEFADSSAEEFASMDFNTVAWTRHGYWWYANEALEPGASTSPLITKVKVGEVGASQLSDFEVIVTHESVQAKGPDGSILAAADAWATVNVDATAAAL